MSLSRQETLWNVNKAVLASEFPSVSPGDIHKSVDGKIYQVWKVDTALGAALADGDVVVRHSGDMITNDLDAGLDTTCGIAAGVMDLGSETISSSADAGDNVKLCYVLIHGVHDAVKVEDSVDPGAGEQLVPDVSTVGEAESFSPAATGLSTLDLTKMRYGVFAMTLAAVVEGTQDTVKALVNVRS